jgi:hypothetical protein
MKTALHKKVTASGTQRRDSGHAKFILSGVPHASFPRNPWSNPQIHLM